MKLRENQIEPVSIGIQYFNLENPKPAIIVAPTAFGKSVVIAHITKDIGENVLVLQPTKELLEQNYNKFIDLGGSAKIFSASMKSKEVGSITYATIGSVIKIAQRIKELGFTKVIIDECDRYPRSKDGMLRKFIDAIKATHVLGLTATPLKLQTNMGDVGPYSKLVMLTNKSKHGNFFKDIIYVSQIQDIVKLGYWTPLVYQSYDFDTGALVFNSSGAEYTNDSIAKAYENQNLENKIIKKVAELENRKSILVAVPTIEQATNLARKIPNSAVVHSEISAGERDRIIKEFRNQQIRVIVQVNVLTVGFDYPELDCLITGRATASISWWYQFVGRGTRIHPDKKDCLVVDFVGALDRFGRVESLYYKQDLNGNWQLYGDGNKLITGIPIHEIGLYLEDGTDLSKNIDEEGNEQVIYMTFGKFKNKPVKSLPPYYRRWLLENVTWNIVTERIRDEIIRLEKIKK
jgi:DNA repair protein RadD